MKRTAIFAHYDHQDEIKPYVSFFLRRLRDVCDEIFFVSTARLSKGELAKVRQFAVDSALIENAGFDFAMWKHGMAKIDLDARDELVLTNSSIFGPIYALGPVFERMARTGCDFWGMTESFEISWHLQSYFLAFKRRAIDSRALSSFFAGVLPYRNKKQVIRSYEVGLGDFLIENGLRAAAVVPRAALLKASPKLKRVCNPTCDHPVDLLRGGMPFVKVELLRDNPSRVRLSPVYRAMEKAGYDMTMVQFDREPTWRESSAAWHVPLRWLKRISR
jgi:rhamnosyltransferase